MQSGKRREKKSWTETCCAFAGAVGLQQAEGVVFIGEDQTQQGLGLGTRPVEQWPRSTPATSRPSYGVPTLDTMCLGPLQCGASQMHGPRAQGLCPCTEV